MALARSGRPKLMVADRTMVEPNARRDANLGWDMQLSLVQEHSHGELELFLMRIFFHWDEASN